jgi:hypothetical protein
MELFHCLERNNNMTKPITLTFFFFFIGLYITQAQSLIWKHTMGDTSSILGDYNAGMARDNNGDLIICGSYAGTMNPDPANATYTITASGTSNSYIAKYTASGNFVWIKQITGPTYESIYAMDLDANGNIYVTGTFASTADFDPGPGTATQTSYGNSSNIFIAKYDNNGNYKWAKGLGSSGNTDNGLDLVVDNAGNVIVTGHFTGSVSFDPSSTVSTVTSLGGMDAFIVKYDSVGTFQWVRAIGSAPHWERGKEIDVDGNNNIYVLGEFASTIDVDPSSVVMNIVPISGTDGDIFFVKYNPQGQPQWAKSLGVGGQFDSNPVMAVSNQYVYLGGGVNDNLDFDLGASTYYPTPVSAYTKGFIAKYDLNAQLIWVKQYQDTAYSTIQKIKIMPNQSLLVGGVFYATSGFNVSFNSNATSYLTNAVIQSPFIAIFDSSMNYQESWFMECSRMASVSDIAAEGNWVYVSGDFEDTVDFDPGAANTATMSNGYRDIYLNKYAITNPTATHSMDREKLACQVYPNPASTEFYVQLKTEEARQIKVSVYDMLGRNMGVLNYHAQPGTNRFSYSIGHLPSGIYSVHVQDLKKSESRFVSKITVE